MMKNDVPESITENKNGFSKIPQLMISSPDPIPDSGHLTPLFTKINITTRTLMSKHLISFQWPLKCIFHRPPEYR